MDSIFLGINLFLFSMILLNILGCRAIRKKQERGEMLEPCNEEDTAHCHRVLSKKAKIIILEEKSGR